KKYVRDVVVVRGNHDNFLPTMRRWFEFEIVDSYLLPPFLVVHGHKPLKEELLSQSWKYLIMGHEHPSIALRDSIGFIGKFPCFLVGNIGNYEKKVVVLPAVGVYQTGSRVTLRRETYLSPIIRDRVEIETLKPVIAAPDVGVLEFPTLRELQDLMA
ncbi:MAG: hypothetical protein NZ925_05695, partial [Sulfolobales archaeon]|nr:hypothetical protein [Sulfolobales archaeon]